MEFEDVCKYYQTGSVKIAAADHLNFYVDKGEFCIIVGPSGAGKTTLLNILGGMDNCDEGNVWLDGRNVSRLFRPGADHLPPVRCGLCVPVLQLGAEPDRTGKRGACQ